MAPTWNPFRRPPVDVRRSAPTRPGLFAITHERRALSHTIRFAEGTPGQTARTMVLVLFRRGSLMSLLGPSPPTCDASRPGMPVQLPVLTSSCHHTWDMVTPSDGSRVVRP